MSSNGNNGKKTNRKCNNRISNNSKKSSQPSRIATVKNTQTVNPRNLCLTTLEKINREDCYSNIAIKQALDDNPHMDARDKAMVKRLVEGCVERQIELDYIIGQFSKTPVNKLKPVIREILRMAIYQIVYMDSIPDSAACNEAVKLATKRGFVNLKGYVNGLLRSVSRSKIDSNTESADKKELKYIAGTNIAYPSKHDREKITDYLSIRYSTPTWLIDMWIGELGIDKTQAILEAFMKERPVCIRLKSVAGRPVKLSDETMVTLAEVNGEDLKGYCYELSSGISPSSLREFEEGLVTVQDPASVLAVLKAGIKSGDLVLDVCAAPGGKSIFAGELAGSSGKVQGFDLSDKKIPLMNQNKLRMKADNVSFAVGDATVFDPKLAAKADVVLCDVPCSGLGVIGKKRDIKYKANEDRIIGLLPIQRDILNNVSQYVKPGGRLCYSTCTISKRENESQVDDFLAGHGDFSLKEMLQLLPCEGRNDGFFIAVLEKQKG